MTRAEYEDALVGEVRKAAADTSEQRRTRLNNAPEYPNRIQIVTMGFKRNPDVIVERLDLAQGACDRCKSHAPFVRRVDGSPYLEVHHIIPLSENGKDTVDNTVALCPNCHREVHFG